MSEQKATKRYSAKELTSHLRAISKEIHTVDDDGRPVDKAEALTRELWKRALGFVEIVEEMKNGKPVTREIARKPEQWALQYIYERLEGRIAPVALGDAQTGIKAESRIGKLAASRLNRIADGSGGPPKLGK